MDETGSCKDSYDGFMLFSSRRTCEHFEGRIALADISIHEDSLFVTMDPDTTIRKHFLAIGRIK